MDKFIKFISFLLLSSFHFPSASPDAINSNAEDSGGKGNFKFNDIPPAKIVAFVGSDISIPCKASIDVQETFSWTFQESPFTTQGYEILGNGTLVLQQVSRKNSGTYRCKVSTGKEAVVSTGVQVNVTTELDFWKEVPVDLNLPGGSEVRLSCSTSFYGDFELCLNARIRWLRNGNYIDEGNTRSYGTAKCGVLHIHDIGKAVEGIYRCEITLLQTGEKLSSPAGELTITDAVVPASESEDNDEGYLYLPPSPPVRLIHTPVAEVEVILGHRAVLECAHNDVESPVPVTWTRSDDQRLDKRNFKMDRMGNLIISKVAFEDSGTYKCALTSEDAEPEGFKLIRLLVLRTPVLLAFPPPTDVLQNGDFFRFNCSAAGVPKPTVEFFKDGVPFSQGGTISHSESHMSASASNTTISLFAITLVKEEDEGIYQCIAKNSAGATSVTAKLTWVYDDKAPEPPSDVIVKETTTTSILFQWQPPKDLGDVPAAELTHYNYDIFFGRSDLKNHVDEVLEFVVNEKLYTNLQPNTSYAFSMRVLTYVNASIIYSNLTDVIHQVTDPEIPTIVSAKLNLSVIDPSTLRVRWKSLPIKDEESDVVEIEQIIQWWTNGVDQLPTAVITLNPRVDEFNITNVPASSTKVKVLVKYIPDQWDPHHLFITANFDVLNYSEWTNLSKKKNGAETAEKEKLQLYLTANASTSVLAEWVVPSGLAEEGQEFNLTYVNERDKKKKFSVVISGSNYHLMEGFEPGCYKFILTVILSSKVSRRSRSATKCEAAICTVIGSSLLRDKFDDEVSADKTLNHIQNFGHSSDLSIWNVNVKNYTSASITLQWMPQKLSRPDFYLIVLKEIRRFNEIGREGSQEELSKHERRDDSIIFELSGKEKGYSGETDWKSSNDYIVINSSLLILTRTSVDLTNLKPNTEYEIQMAPGTIEMVGEPISPLYVTTLEGVPSEPQNFMWFPLTTSTVNISWTPPDKMNGNVVEYLILYSNDNTKWENKSISSEFTHATLTGLVSNTKYFVRICGVTKVGPGESLNGEVYIQAILDFALTTNSMSMEMIIICVISTLVLVTGIVLTYLITTMCRLRRRASLRTQAPSPSRIMFTGNGFKDRDILRAVDSKGQIDDASISPLEVSTRHLDTKGRQVIEENHHLLETPFKDEVSSESECKEMAVSPNPSIEPTSIASSMLDFKRPNHIPGKQKGNHSPNYIKGFREPPPIVSSAIAESYS